MEILQSYTSLMASDTDLALRRTLLAHDRTLMAWIRTSVSLISFGFTIYKFFQYLVETEKTSLPHTHFGPRQFAIGMISVGVLALAIAIVDYRRSVKVLEQEHSTRYQSLTGVLAAIIFFMGLALLIVVLLCLLAQMGSYTFVLLELFSRT